MKQLKETRMHEISGDNKKGTTAKKGDVPYEFAAVKNRRTKKRDLTGGGDFETSRREELKGLIENKPFVTVPRAELPEGTRVFGSRFVDDVKKAVQRWRRKSRLVAQNNSGEGATRIKTKAPTVQWFTQRLLLSLAESDLGMKSFMRDITQTFSKANLSLRGTYK